MKRGILLFLMTFSLSASVFENKKVENMTQAFEAHPRFAEYTEAMKSSKEKAMQIKKEMAEDITKKLLADMVSETNKLAQKGVAARIENYDIQTKVNLANLYMKSEKVLEPATQKATFNPNLSTFVERIFNKTGTAYDKAQEIKEKFTFNDNGKFIDELIEISKIADEIASNEKAIANSEKNIANSEKNIANSEKNIANSEKNIKARENILSKLESIRK